MLKNIQEQIYTVNKLAIFLQDESVAAFLFCI